MRALLAVLALALTGSPVLAAQVIGTPVVKEGLRIVPRYLTGVEMDRAPPGTGKDAIHLEADIRATKDEAHGFAENDWVPYLTVNFQLTKDDAPVYKKTGLLYPMTAKGGPHYGGSADLAGPGTYHLTYIVSPPVSRGLIRHIDKDGGVPDWWKPFTIDWTFTVPSAKD